MSDVGVHSSSELIGRLEAAEAGNRELSCDVAIALGEWTPPRGAERDPVHRDIWRRSGLKHYQPYSDVTTSLDAALALAERVLPGCYWLLGKGRTRPDEPLYGVQMMAGEGAWHDPTKVTAEAEAPTPALALCTAILKARASNTPSNTAGDEEKESAR